MTGNEDTLKALRAALEVSPDNLPLRLGRLILSRKERLDSNWTVAILVVTFWE